MNMLRVFADGVDRLNESIYRAAAWIILPVVLVAFAVVCLRYAFAIGYPWLQEIYIWLHGAAFTLASAWVLRQDGHVRVDVVTRHLSLRTRAWLDLIGVLAFLLPMMCLMIWWSWPIIQRSWRLLERSPTTDGLPFAFALKSFVLVLCTLLILQGLAMAARAVLVIVTREGADPAPAASG